MIDSIKVEEVKSDGTKKEINTDPSSGYHNYLVMFNTLIDLDFGILRMIQAEYTDIKKNIPVIAIYLSSFSKSLYLVNIISL